MLSRDKLKQLRAEPLGASPNRVRRARELAELTQVQIAAATGLTQAFISSIENGDYSDVTLTTSRALARFFGCQIEDLFPSREAVA